MLAYKALRTKRPGLRMLVVDLDVHQVRVQAAFGDYRHIGIGQYHIRCYQCAKQTSFYIITAVCVLWDIHIP
jgi:hypothetical protein